MGCTLIDVRHIFDRSPPTICNVCGGRITAEHILLRCSKYSNERQYILSWLRENNLPISMPSILKDCEIIHLIIDFLVKVKMINEI